MKITVFGIRGFPFIGGGAERHCEELYPRLVTQGYEVTVLCRKYYFPTYRGVTFKNLPYVNTTSLECMTHSLLSSLYCLFLKPDIVHIHNMGACLLVPLLKLRGIKVVVTIHSLNYLHSKWGWFARFVLNTCERIGIRWADRIITVSREMRVHLSKKYKDRLNICFIPNGVNKAEYVKPGSALRRYRLEKGKYAMAVGRLTPEKGFDRLIEAYKSIDNPPFKLVIVGSSDKRTKYEAYLMGERSENVILTGFLCGKELAEIYSNAGMFVTSSLNEGFPMVVLEALSYGLPILASAIPPHKEIGLPNWRYFDIDNMRNFAFKLQEILDKGITEEEKSKYRAMLRNNLNWDTIAKDTIDVYGRG